MKRITLQRGTNTGYFTSYATSSISNGDSTKCIKDHRRIKHLRTVHSDFKEQITICEPQQNRFISFSDIDFVMGQTSASRKLIDKKIKILLTHQTVP